VRGDKPVDDVSYNGWSGWLTNNGLDRRTVAEIQRKVIKRGGRSTASLLFHAKSDKEAIVAWRVELNRILHVVNVRSIALTWSSLTVPFQTELVVNIHVVVSDIHYDVSKIRGENSGQVRSVRAKHTQSIDNRRVPTIVQAQTRSAVSTTKGSSTLRLHLVHLDFQLPRHRGHISDVTS